MNRAYSILDVKSIDEEARIFRGVATTPTFDRMDDRIDPTKAVFAPEIQLLHAHKHDAPIGSVKLGKPIKTGIPFEASIPVINEPPTLKERVDVAWGELKHGLVKAVSIGFRALEAPTFNAKGGLDFGAIEIMELSTVAIPANSEAIIHTIKSIDQLALKAAGIEDDPLPEIPSASDEPAAQGNAVRVVRLGDAAQDRARKPFVLRKIVRT